MEHTREAEAGEISELKASLIYSEFQDNQGYKEKPCLEKKRLGGGHNENTLLEARNHLAIFLFMSP